MPNVAHERAVPLGVPIPLDLTYQTLYNAAAQIENRGDTMSKLRGGERARTCRPGLHEECRTASEEKGRR